MNNIIKLLLFSMPPSYSIIFYEMPIFIWLKCPYLCNVIIMLNKNVNFDMNLLVLAYVSKGKKI